MAKQMFVNLPVKSLARAMKFWRAIGFKFDKEFTDENATCLVLGRNMFAMLLTEKFFKSFIKKGVCNTKKGIEAITALQLGSKSEVRKLTAKALAAGAREARKPYDYGWMYGTSFYDPDGHNWEFFFMDMKGYRAAQKKGKKK
ncbi:MAG: VOC family protein [Candidatus Micrarchaeia archaeon]|jgi:predicted lactoylglutathione lyase